ncbi:MAG: hypothetical protein EA382_03180, partial [Spirochaetaceae bacterium]
MIAMVIASCAGDVSGTPAAPNPRVVEGFTSGEISRWSPIRIAFAEPVGAREQTSTIEAGRGAGDILSFTPAIAGSARWVDAWTLEFAPDAPLRAGQRYRAAYRPSEALKPVTEPFEFDFLVVPDSVDLEPAGLRIVDARNPRVMEFHGVLTFADSTTIETARAGISVKHHGAQVAFVIDPGPTPAVYRIRVPGIIRQERESRMEIAWRYGRDAATRGSHAIAIPPTDEFDLIGVRIVSDGDRHVELSFSQPLDESQNPAGLFQVDGVEVSAAVRSNQVRLYAPAGWPQVASVVVNSAVRSAVGQVLAQRVVRPVAFPTEKPRVRFVGGGVIVPTSQGTTVAIETMNLNAIMVEAIQIHGSNVHQFLQVNRLDGDRELHRVGEVVWRDIVDLEWSDANVDRWVRYGLDLSPLVARDPAGLYQLRITFRQPHVQFPCAVASADPVTFATASGPQADASFWDFATEYPPWEYRPHRTDPCHPAYYMQWFDHSITVTRNVMVSNIGLLAKSGQDGRLIVAASDLRTTEPLRGVSLELFNFERRSLGRTVSDANGIAAFDTARATPFFLLAAGSGQFGYLKLDAASALNVSQFQTAGAGIEGGIQGMLFGERGVWRPGDDIYLTFILHDIDRTIPTDHPVRFEIHDPRGRLVDSATLQSGLNGMYSYVTRTAPDAMTGTYTARAILGGRSFTTALRVESVVPNRLRIALDFDGDPEYLTSGRIGGTVWAQWLHGATAPGLDADIRANFSATETVFAGYEGYTFDDPARDFYAEQQELFDGSLDEEGKARFSSIVNVAGAPGLLRADFTTRVFERGGGFSTEYRSIPFHAYEQYVGVRTPRGDEARGMLLTDTDHAVDIVLVDTDGVPVRSGRVTAEIYKVNWRWWWETDPDNLAAYVASSSLAPIASGQVQVRDGRGSWRFRIDYPDWGRYLVRVTDAYGGHSAGRIVYVDWPGWAGRALDEGAAGATMLVLQPERSSYRVGEMISVQLPVSDQGRGLVTVESRGRVLQSDWILGSGPQTRYQFTATADMAPNVYVHVTYLQPHLQTANDLPIRTYGVVPIDVIDPDTRIEPVIRTHARYRPGETVAIDVSEASRNAMTYTVAIVDEGLLGLTRHRTPNPWAHFYQRLASSVSSWDLYNYVASAFAGRLDTMLAIGGGDAGSDDAERDRNRFDPVVIVIPPTELGAGQTNRHQITIPNYIGAVRVMVVASSDSGTGRAYGVAETEVPVSQEVMVLGTLPRVLGVDERIVAPVTVFAHDEGPGSVLVSIDVDGSIEVIGSRTATLRFDAPGEQLHRFALRTDAATGSGTVRFTARRGSVTAVHEVQIAVRASGSTVATVTPVPLRANQRTTVPVPIVGVDGTNVVSLEIARIPPIDLSRRLGFLLQYPHGCIEQTTSAAFPQLYLDRLHDLSASDRERSRTNIVHAIERIGLFETPSGGLSYWPGQSVADDWSTTYAGHFMLEAQRRGYAVNESLLSRWTDYQLERANAWYATEFDSVLTQSYRLYTLALARRPAFAAMNRLREIPGLPAVVRWRLASTYALAGNSATAMQIIRGVSVDVGAYEEPGRTYGGEIRDLSMILEALVELGDSRAGDVARDISDALTSDIGMSTQTSAYALLAMAKFAHAADPVAGLDVSWSWNGSPAERVRSDRPMVVIDLPVEARGQSTLVLQNHTSGQLFPRLIVSGTPQQGSETAVESGLRLNVTYSVDGGRSPVDRLAIGTDVEIAVQVTNLSRTRNYTELVLVHVVPAGWEISNDRLAGAQFTEPFTYRDVRDDRVFTYFDLDARRSATFRITATAAYEGEFYLPMVLAESMYDPGVVAVEPGFRVEVV